MKYTENYEFRKPEYTDVADVEDLNYNFDELDDLLYNKFETINVRFTNVSKGIASIIVATYDTKNPLKHRANYTCTQDNANEVIAEAISKLVPGGVLELMDGTYELNYDKGPIELEKFITIKGSGFKTVIKQPADTEIGEAKPAFILKGDGNKIENMMICDSEVTSPHSLISLQDNSSEIKDVFFIIMADRTKTDGCSCVQGASGADCRFTRIENCRVFKQPNVGDVMFDFSACSNFSGVIGSNISSGHGAISVRFADENHRKKTAIYGHSDISITLKG